MANIDRELTAIRTARYGRDVRTSIHDAINAVNSSAEGSALAAETAKAAAEAARREAETAKTEAKSWAVGKTGIREGEDTNCSEYYSKQSQNSAALSEDYYNKTKQAGDNAINTLNGAIDRINKNIPKFWINPEDGILYHTPSRFTWVINRITGQLEWGLTV